MPNKSLYYIFTMHVVGERKPQGGRKMQPGLVADFAILWCVEDNWFYVVPRNEIGKINTINIPVREITRSRWEQFYEAWHLLEVEEVD